MDSIVIPTYGNAVLFNNLKTKTMKKFFGTLLTIALFAATPAAAQFNFGVKAGVNIAERPTDLNSLKAAAQGNAGWYVGPMAKFTIPVIGLGFEANLLYSQTGTTIDGKNINKQSIDIPVYLRYELSLPAINKFVEPFVAIGPQWSWNIGEKNFVWQLAESTVTGEDLTTKYTLESSTLSLNLGLGVVLLDHIQVHANYNLALGNTSNYMAPDFTAAESAYKHIKSKTNVWQVSVGYIF